MKNSNTLTEQQLGCWLDGSRGHYLTQDVILLARDFGFILSPFETFAVERYASDGHEDDYPFEALVDLCDKAIAWLNAYGDDRLPGQNFPPQVPMAPEGLTYLWAFEDGDFGLWLYDENGVVDLPLLG